MRQYKRDMKVYNRELFEHYKTVAHLLLLVGDELAANGTVGLDKRFPWLHAGDCDCTTARGYSKGPDGESLLYVQKGPDAAKDPFPVHWNRLAEAIRYFLNSYGNFSYWFIISDLSSINPPGPGIFVHSDAFYHDSERYALQDMIHEPLHDFCVYGLDYDYSHWNFIRDPRYQHAKIREIFPTLTEQPPSSKYGCDWTQLMNFLDGTDAGGMSLWDRILEWAGPKPTKPVMPTRPSTPEPLPPDPYEGIPAGPFN